METEIESKIGEDVNGPILRTPQKIPKYMESPCRPEGDHVNIFCYFTGNGTSASQEK